MRNLKYRLCDQELLRTIPPEVLRDMRERWGTQKCEARMKISAAMMGHKVSASTRAKIEATKRAADRGVRMTRAKLNPRRQGMIPRIGMRAALDDPALLGGVLNGDSWSAWRILLISAMGEQLTADERVTFKQLTNREREPGKRVEEFVAVIGRRGGKSRAMATLACYIAGLCDHPLVSGERGVVLCIAPDQRQAKITLDYANAAFEGSPILRQLIANRTQDSLELNNQITLEVRAASFRRLRGPTYASVICDEAAFWYSDEFASNCDTEIINAIRPGLATTGGPLIIASSPYARKGILWETYRQHYGPAGDPLILVAKGTTRELNPSLPQRVIDRALERDHAAASAEYLAEFRTDPEAFVNRDIVERCVTKNTLMRTPIPGAKHVGFCDPSGGSSDSMTICVGHFDKKRSMIVVDLLQENRPPFSPEAACAQYASLLKPHGITKIVGDRYAGQWPVEQLAKVGIIYEHSEKPKSDLYLDLLAMLNSGRIDLLDNQKLVTQLCSLERRTSQSGGEDSIDHPPNQHDDIANSCAGCCSILINSKKATPNLGWISGPDKSTEDKQTVAAQLLLSHLMRLGFRA